MGEVPQERISRIGQSNPGYLDRDMWEYAQTHKLLPKIEMQKILSREEINRIVAYFIGDASANPGRALLDKFSMAVARLV